MLIFLLLLWTAAIYVGVWGYLLLSLDAGGGPGWGGSVASVIGLMAMAASFIVLTVIIYALNVRESGGTLLLRTAPYLFICLAVGGYFAITMDPSVLIRGGHEPKDPPATAVPDSKWKQWRLQPTKRDGQIVELRSIVDHDLPHEPGRSVHKSAEWPLTIMMQLTELEVLEYDGSNPAVLELSLPNMRKLRRCTLYGIDLKSADRLFTELSRLPNLESLTLKRCRGVNSEQLKNRPGFHALKSLTVDDDLESSKK